ncbi:MAG: glycosyltransferase family 4 protein, partial [Flavobacteriales bacterium]|nr:glycosyltransferase family 4 protein [Flavobacteriales bacterium]
SNEDQRFKLFYFIKTDDKQLIKRRFEDRNIPLTNVVFLSIWNNRFKSLLEWLEFSWKLKAHRIKLLQVVMINSPEDQIPQLERLSKSSLKLAFTVTYNAIPTAFESNHDPRFERDRKKYGAIFSRIDFDGLLSWYDHIVPFVHSSDLFESKPPVQVINSRFCDSSRYYPEEKENWIVFASALVNYKHPMMFVEAIQKVRKSRPELLSGWKVKIIGNGPLQEATDEYIKANDLQDLVERTSGLDDISPILRKSKAYVSAQETENFPSLAMNEAMASGNVIIARDVGRTHLFVKHGENGFLTPRDQDNADGLGECLLAFLSNADDHERMMDSSVKLTQT